MKKLSFLFLTVFFFACEKEGDLTKSGSTIEVGTTAMLKFTGNFTPTSGISATGATKVYLENNRYKLQLENVSISSGPDLKVYLSTIASPTTFINLGNFTGNGTSTYNIPDGTSLTEYKYVLIHCQQYNHLFATSILSTN